MSQNTYKRSKLLIQVNDVSELKVYDHGLSVAAYIMTNLVPNIVENIFCLPPNYI